MATSDRAVLELQSAVCSELQSLKEELHSRMKAHKQVIADFRSRENQLRLENKDMVIEMQRLCQVNLELKSKLKTTNTQLKREQALRYDDGEDVLYTVFLEETWDGEGDERESYEEYWKNEIHNLGHNLA